MHDDIPLAYRATKGGLWVTVSSGWQLLFGFIANIILTRLLIPSAFGEFALAMFFVQLVRINTKIGFGQAFIQHREASGDAVGTLFVVEGFAALAGLVFLIILTYVLPHFGYSEGIMIICIVLSISIAIEGISGVGCLFLERELLFKDISLLRGITFPLSYIPAFWGALHGAGAWSIVAQNMTHSILFLIGVYWVAYKRLPHISRLSWRFNTQLAKKFFRFGAMVGVTSTAGMLFMKLDSFFIGTFVGITTLGFYDRAYNTAQWPGTFCSVVLSRSVFFIYSQLQNDLVRLKKTASIVTWLVTNSSFPLGLVLFITAPDLIIFLYGSPWLPSVDFLQILILYTTLRPLQENAGIILMALGKPHLTTRFNVIQLVVLAIIGLPFTLIWGAIGTSIAIVIAFAPGLVIAYYDVAKVIPFRPLSNILPSAFICLITFAGFLLLNKFIPISQMVISLRVIIKIVYTLSTFFFLLFIIQPRVTRERISYIMTLIRQS